MFDVLDSWTSKRATVMLNSLLEHHYPISEIHQISIVTFDFMSEKQIYLIHYPYITIHFQTSSVSLPQKKKKEKNLFHFVLI